MGYSASLARQRTRRERSPEVSKLAQGAQTEKKLREVPQSQCVTQSENSEEYYRDSVKNLQKFPPDYQFQISRS